MTIRLILAASAATACLAACGEDKPAEPARQAENRQALLDFARCMRENGVDMPDPQFDGDRVMMRAGGAEDADPETLRTAEQACAKFRDAVKPPELSEEEQAEFKAAALKHARCMREHGIKDFPDPQFDENGGVQIRMGGNLDPNDPRLQAAQKACEGALPGLRRAGGEK